MTAAPLPAFENGDVQRTPAKGSTGASCTEKHARSPPGPGASTAPPRSGGDAARTVNAWREQWKQLGLQAWSAESDGRRETQNPRSLSTEQLEELRSTLRSGETDFGVWEKELWAGLTKVRKRVHVLARNMHFAPHHGDVRRMVQCAEHDLRIFAEQTRQEEDELAALECSLEDTLESSLARFEGWCSQDSSLRRPPENMSKPSRPPSCSRLPQTSKGGGPSKATQELDSMHEELDKLTAEITADGGSTGGWSSDDHDTFLRVFHKFKRKTGVEFIAEVQQLLPEKQHEDLVEHVRWLLLYEDRQLQKRQFVEKWRCMRAAASAKEASAAAKQEQLTAAAARDEKRQRASSRERVQKDLSQRKQQVAEWRNARSDEHRIQREVQQRHSEEAKERESQQRQQQQEQRRKAIAASKEQRAAEEAIMGRPTPSGRGHRNSASPASAVSRPVAAEDKKRIAERNAALLQRRASLVQAKRDDEERFEPPPRASSVSAALRNVESRLEEHTKAYIDRSREISEEQSTVGFNASKYGVVPGNFAHQGLVRTMRAPASWRPNFGA